MFAFRSQPGLEDENLICVCLIININPFLKVFLLGPKKKYVKSITLEGKKIIFLNKRNALASCLE